MGVLKQSPWKSRTVNGSNRLIRCMPALFLSTCKVFHFMSFLSQSSMLWAEEHALLQETYVICYRSLLQANTLRASKSLTEACVIHLALQKTRSSSHVLLSLGNWDWTFTLATLDKKFCLLHRSNLIHALSRSYSLCIYPSYFIKHDIVWCNMTACVGVLFKTLLFDKWSALLFPRWRYSEGRSL